MEMSLPEEVEQSLDITVNADNSSKNSPSPHLSTGFDPWMTCPITVTVLPINYNHHSTKQLIIGGTTDTRTS